MDLPIGVFDSGIGGLSVVKEILKTLPNESLIYLGDTARVPYGNRNKDTITKFALELTQFLLKQKVKAIVVACNTMSAASLTEIKKLAKGIPVIDVIGPTVSFAALETSRSVLGVIGTRATISSAAYEKEFSKINKQIKVIARVGPLFIPLVEEGLINHPVAKLIAEEYLKDFRNSGVDILILGCTHYPLLSDVIGKIVGNKIKLIDSGAPTSIELKKVLEEKKLLRRNNSDPEIKFYLTDVPERVYKIANTFFDNNFHGKFEKIQL